MAARNARLLRAVLVATLVSFLLMQGVAGVFEACFCSCYKVCKRKNPHLPREKCHWWCFTDNRCSFSCSKGRGHRGHSSSDDAVGVAIASGGGSLRGMANGTGAGGAVAAGGGSLAMVNGTGEGTAP
ncbi:uncharacterized protein C2845_PM07G21100 [Panicum miliaceum]|uniref:Uncharacterized protein n=1 Tax=Panicum miliaceum TaxID=4540 RepID=A0A3L6SIN0_PANMI|nr:uncharacterized protein C2845_PM07G21100 [Panicum miliaceum]